MSKNHYNQCQFLIGANSIGQLPQDRGIEVAIIGASNTGKSSVINAITANSKLARTSKTPGRTRQINVFSINANCRLIDLPGYGYARVSNATRAHWDKTLNQYFRERNALSGLVMIIDIRRGMKPADRHILDWSLQTALPVHILLNKSDKLLRAAANRALATFQTDIGDRNNVSIQLFSALKNTGVGTARSVLDRWFEMPGHA